MKKLPPQDEQSIAAVRVRLPKIFGLEPRQYIVAAWALILGGLALGILVIPGLVNPGEHVRIEASVPGASVLIDGIRVGESPWEGYVGGGTHRVTVRTQGFSTWEEDLSFRRSWFATLFPLGRTVVEAPLLLTDPERWLASLALEFSRWSLSPNGALEYHVPPILFPGLRNYVNHGQDPASPRVSLLFMATAGHIGNRTQLEDWLAAREFTMGTAGHDDSRRWLMAHGYLDDPVYAPVITQALGPGSDLNADHEALVRDAAALGTDPWLPVEALGSTVTVNGLAFTAFRSTGGYTILVANAEVDEALFYRFLRDRPEWAPDQRANLRAQGLADEHYLADLVPSDTNGRRPVHSLSLAAAEAFMHWYSETQTPGVWEARLPNMEQWSAADGLMGSRAGKGPWLVSGQALSTSYDLASGPLRHWYGGVFEWTASSASLRPPKAAYAALFAEARAAFPGFQRHLSGGAASLTEATFLAEGKTVWAYPTDWTSDLVGFRLWLFPASIGGDEAP